MRLTLAHLVSAPILFYWLEVEPAGKHQGVEVCGAADVGIRVLDPHVAEPYDGFKTPLEVLSHPKHDAGLDAEVKIFVFLQPVARMIRIRLFSIVDGKQFPNTLFNPIFISLILTLLLVGDWAMAHQLEKWFPTEKEPIRFVSDRKSVSLLPEEILYIESNDKEVTVYVTEGRRFRNRTGIAQWESLLGGEFVRIHRSYLVRRSAITSVSSDSLQVGDTSLPISRKYREVMKKE